MFCNITDAFKETPIIKNNGRNSGNPFFWMFNDAMKLAELTATE